MFWALYTNRCPTVGNAHTSSTKICDSEVQVFGDVESLPVCMGFHFVLGDGYADSDEVMAVLVVNRLFLHVVLQNARRTV